MLPKKYRLVKEKDIKQVFRQSRKIQFGSVQLLLRFKKPLVQSPDNSLRIADPNFRALVIVSKKIHKRAVKRNRIRRSFQAILENLLKNPDLSLSLDMVIMVKDKKILEEKIQEIYSVFLDQTLTSQKEKLTAANK